MSTCGVCSQPRKGVVTTLGAHRSGESFASAPVCESRDCIEDAITWVRRVARRAAYHVKDSDR
jgi:hypothetical protein